MGQYLLQHSGLGLDQAVVKSNFFVQVLTTMTFIFFRLTSLNEVHRRHESDLDKIVDDLISSQSEIESFDSRIPEMAERHRFYQDLRGYVTDLVECFNEKVSA